MTTQRLYRFTMIFWLTVAMCVVCAALFGAYAFSVSRLIAANEQRLHSWQLASELRQSSDDLTRMMRTYAVTGDVQYKENYQEILDIRNGIAPRPIGYENVYWDLALGGKRPSSKGEIAPLIQRMNQAGFTGDELRKLSDAKNKSDQLVSIERMAMRLTDASEKSSLQRWSAIEMLHNDLYHQAKFNIMQPIADFNQMVDGRTDNDVRKSKISANVLMVAFSICGVGLLWLLWQVRRSFRAIVGGSVADLHQLVNAPSSAVAKENNLSTAPTIMEQLTDLKSSNAMAEDMRRDTERALAEAERRFVKVIEDSSEGVCVVQDAVICMANPKIRQMLGYAIDSMIGRPFIDFLVLEDRALLLQQFQQAGAEHRFEGVRKYRLRAASGDSIYFKIRVSSIQWAGRAAMMYFLNQAEKES